MRRLLLVALVASVLVLVGPADAIGAPRTLAQSTTVRSGGVVDPSFPVDYVGVVSSAPAEGARVRFRHGSRWGDWQPLVEDGVEAPGQWASGLAWADDADAYQLVLPADVARVRGVAINTTDGPRRSQPGSAAGAATTVVGRAEWGADESLMTWAPTYYGPAQKLTVHHTATANGDADPAATVRAIYRYHAVDRGFGDIGYHLLVDEAGRVYEGRWSGTDGDPSHDDPTSDGVVTAAHVSGYNSANLGVALLGTFTDRSPTPAAQSSLEDVLATWAQRHGIAPTGSGTYVNPVNGTTWTGPNIPGHRDFAATECPGGSLYALLPTVRSNVADRLATTPPPTDTTAPSITNLTVTTTRSGATVRWATNEPATTEVRYRLDGKATTYQSVTVGGTRTSHVVSIDGLRPKTRYRLVAVSVDAAGNRAESAELAFTTKR